MASGSGSSVWRGIGRGRLAVGSLVGIGESKLAKDRKVGNEVQH